MKVRIAAVLSRNLEYPCGAQAQVQPYIVQDVKFKDFDGSVSLEDCLKQMRTLYPDAMTIELEVLE